MLPFSGVKERGGLLKVVGYNAYGMEEYQRFPIERVSIKEAFKEDRQQRTFKEQGSAVMYFDCRKSVLKGAELCCNDKIAFNTSIYNIEAIEEHKLSARRSFLKVSLEREGDYAQYT